MRVSNPTNGRVEAVISVDGLDVIDGESADYRSKRGYIVPPHGNLVIDGFRVSTQAVAAFRFSSVANSYAGRKGKARNVGVVGVALFAEKAQPAMIIPRPQPRPRPHHRPSYDKSRDLEGEDFSSSEPAPTAAPGPSRPSSRVVTKGRSSAGKSYRPERRQERPGLGTEFGERRHSAVNFTQFVRAHPNRPSAIAELRYNDAQGLQALGIRLRSEFPSQDELATRESANPFPGMRFAQPPR